MMRLVAAIVLLASLAGCSTAERTGADVVTDDAPFAVLGDAISCSHMLDLVVCVSVTDTHRYVQWGPTEDEMTTTVETEL